MCKIYALSNPQNRLLLTKIAPIEKKTESALQWMIEFGFYYHLAKSLPSLFK